MVGVPNLGKRVRYLHWHNFLQGVRPCGPPAYTEPVGGFCLL